MFSDCIVFSRKNKDVARRAIQAIRSGVLTIGQHPEAGHPSEEMGPEYREWLINFGNSGYVALYHYDREIAVIVALRHQKEAGY